MRDRKSHTNKKMSSDFLSEGDPMPLIRFPRFLRGDPVPIPSPGRAMILEFFRTTCPPCVRSLGSLTRLQKSYPQVPIVAVTFEHVDAVKSFMRRRRAQIGFRIIEDRSGDAIATALSLEEFYTPLAILVDNNAIIRFIGHPKNPKLPGLIKKYSEDIITPIIRESGVAGTGGSSDLVDRMLREAKDLASLKEK